MLVATFLPLFEPTGQFLTIQQNTLIQHGGWLFLVAAVAAAAAGFRSYLADAQWWLPLAGAAFGVITLALWATSAKNRTLYPVGLDGEADTSQGGVVADLGIAIWVAGLGVALVAVGAVLNRELDSASSRSTKKCPDCAETVLADARICKHCSYRFPEEAYEPVLPDSEPDSKTVRCHSCGSVQTVPKGTRLTTCERCEAALKVPRGA